MEDRAAEAGLVSQEGQTGGLLAQSTISMNRPDYHLERIDSHLIPSLMAESTQTRKLELDQAAWRLMRWDKAHSWSVTYGAR